MDGGGYTDLQEFRKEIKDVLHGLLKNPHICLSDQVYNVRDHEGLGWDGPAVLAWSEAVAKAEQLLKILETRD
jgi:hypothetical protein